MSVTVVDFELARTILLQAINQFGTNLTYKNLDRIIHSSELQPQTNKHTRACLKSMLINLERHNGDLDQTLQIEQIKHRILQTAKTHYRQNLMAKAFCAIIKAVI